MNAGNAERGAGMSGMIAKLKNIVLNGTPNSRSADGCPSGYAGRMGRNRCPGAVLSVAVQNVFKQRSECVNQGLRVQVVRGAAAEKTFDPVRNKRDYG